MSHSVPPWVGIYLEDKSTSYLDCLLMASLILDIFINGVGNSITVL